MTENSITEIVEPDELPDEVLDQIVAGVPDSAVPDNIIKAEKALIHSQNLKLKSADPIDYGR